MGELVKAFHKFLMRDLSYITGGGAVILSFLYIFNQYPDESTPIYLYALGVAIAYVVGYAIQDALGLFRLIRMKAGYPPNRFGRWLYKRYDRETIRETPKTSKALKSYRKKYETHKKWLYTSAAQRYKDDHERIEGLKQVGFTVGPCLIISGPLLLIRSGFCLRELDCYLPYASILIGAALYILGWLKVTQQTQYVLRFSRKPRRRTNRRIKGKTGVRP